METAIRISLVTLILLLSGPKFAGAQAIAVFGDSITEGYGLPSPSTQNWTADLIKLLPNTYSYGFDGGEIGATLQINPVQGPSYQKDNNSGILLASLNSSIFFIMLGTNDGKTANQAGTTANFVPDYETLLNRIKGSSAAPSTVLMSLISTIRSCPLFQMEAVVTLQLIYWMESIRLLREISKSPMQFLNLPLSFQNLAPSLCGFCRGLH